MFCKDKSRKPQQPLGRWTRTPTDREWPAYYNFQRNTATVKQPDKSYKEFYLEHENRRAYRVSNPTNCPIEWKDQIPAACESK
jgi:hypothetical protein